MRYRYHAISVFFVACGVPAAVVAQGAPVPSNPVVFSYRSSSTGLATLRARTADLVHRRVPLRVTLRAVYRYDPQSDTWARVGDPLPPWIVPIPRSRKIYSSHTDPVLYRFPPVGLFWAIWEESGQRHSSPAYAGPTLCQDVMLGPAPSGKIAMCVPFADHAEARFVLNPAGLRE